MFMMSFFYVIACQMIRIVFEIVFLSFKHQDRRKRPIHLYLHLVLYGQGATDDLLISHSVKSILAQILIRSQLHQYLHESVLLVCPSDARAYF